MTSRPRAAAWMPDGLLRRRAERVPERLLLFKEAFGGLRPEGAFFTLPALGLGVPAGFVTVAGGPPSAVTLRGPGRVDTAHFPLLLSPLLREQACPWASQRDWWSLLSRLLIFSFCTLLFCWA